MTDEHDLPSDPSTSTSPRRRVPQCNADYRWTVPKVQAFLRAPGWTGPPFAKRSPWEGPGLEALDYLRAGASQADTSGGQADTGVAQANADMRHNDARRPQADADRHKPTTFPPGRCNTRSMSPPPRRGEGG